MFTCANLTLANLNATLFKNLSLTLLPGAIYTLQGKNGIGKTSFFKTTLGIIKPNEGQILWRGQDIELSPYVSYLGHENAVKENLSVVENLMFWASLKNTESLILPALAQFGLIEYADLKCKYLSAGMQKKVALARMVVSNAKLWLMDEPEANLDDKGKEQLLKLLQVKISNGGMAIIATHNKEYYKNIPIINLEDFKHE